VCTAEDGVGLLLKFTTCLLAATVDAVDRLAARFSKLAKYVYA